MLRQVVAREAFNGAGIGCRIDQMDAEKKTKEGWIQQSADN